MPSDGQLRRLEVAAAGWSAPLKTAKESENFAAGAHARDGSDLPEGTV